MSLCLHAGAQHINRDQLAALPLPAARGSRHAIRPFIADIEMIDGYLQEAGFALVDESFGVKSDKDNMPSQFFGAMEIRPKTLEGVVIPAGSDDKTFGLTIGLRGSYDQTLPRGIAVGSRVFVCDNLAFSGEVSVYSKQTTNINSRIEVLLRDAVNRIPAMAQAQTARFDAYRNFELSQVKGDAILIECVRRGILNPSNVGQAIKEWDTPSHIEHAAEGKTVWTLFNAVTEAIKPSNKDRAHILSAWERTVPLTSYLDAGVGLIH